MRAQNPPEEAGLPDSKLLNENARSHKNIIGIRDKQGSTRNEITIIPKTGGQEVVEIVPQFSRRIDGHDE